MERKRKQQIIALCVVGMLLIYGVFSQFGHLSLNLPLERKAEFSDDQIALYPSTLQVAGNQIKDEDGQVVVLKGVMTPDPAVLKDRGLFDRELFADIQATQANVVRIPVHPESWVQDEYYLWRYLDPIVRWTGELNMYVIIDWHYIGNIATGAGEQMPDIKTPPKDLTTEFWQLTASYFHDAPNVIFEVFNEPESIEVQVWRSSAAEIVKLIREQDARQIIVVGGIDFGRDLSWVVENPVEGANIAYASHIYPVHSSSEWDNWFGDVAEQYPVLITEWGFMDENRNAGPEYLSGDEMTYGKPLLQYLDAHGMGWIGCWYDSQWMPPMFARGMQARTGLGDFIIRELAK